jgi:hypothetical protein
MARPVCIPTSVAPRRSGRAFAEKMNTRTAHIGTPFLTLIVAILGAGVLGAVTNFINGRVSPLYFRNIMRWNDVSDIPRAAIAQGIFEGSGIVSSR